MFSNLLSSMEEKWSTLFSGVYLITGMLFLFEADPMVKLTGGWLMFLGVASGGFHWTLTKLWQTLDVGAIYGTLWALVYTLIHFLSPETSLWLLIPIATAKGILMVFWKGDFSSMKTVPMIYFLVFVLMELHYPGARNWVSLTFLLLGAACQFIGEERYPEYKDQWHAGWHVLTNIGLGLVIFGG